MSRPRSQIADYAVYVAVRFFVCVLQMLSLPAACRVADALAWLLYRIDRRHRQVAQDNLCHAFPDQFSAVQRTELVRQVYAHFCRLLIEIIHMPRRLHTHNWKRYVNLAEVKILVDRLLSNRPLMFVTGHFGNWEMGGYVLGLLGMKTHAVARPLDNPYLDDFLRQFRERTGQKLLAKKGDFDQMQAILAKGGVIGTLGDQDAGQRGLFVDFFNRPASTHKAIALLALEFNVPLLVVHNRRTGGPLEYEVRLEDVVLPEEYAAAPDAVRAITQRFTLALERGIRLAPEQYFWLHRRWKHQPKKTTAPTASSALSSECRSLQRTIG
jgi:KDO2-lipid IV(A) lauroyltransferase